MTFFFYMQITQQLEKQYTCKDIFGPVNKCLIINIKHKIKIKSKIFSYAYQVHINCLKFENNGYRFILFNVIHIIIRKFKSINIKLN